MRILVCGGRDYREASAVKKVLDELRPSLVIHGGAHGADRLAGAWAESARVPCMVFPAPWRAVGPAAGPLRNGWMLQHGRPELVVAFPGGRGTADMVRRANHQGVPVRRIAGEEPRAPEEEDDAR